MRLLLAILLCLWPIVANPYRAIYWYPLPVVYGVKWLPVMVCPELRLIARPQWNQKAQRFFWRPEVQKEPTHWTPD